MFYPCAPTTNHNPGFMWSFPWGKPLLYCMMLCHLTSEVCTDHILIRVFLYFFQAFWRASKKKTKKNPRARAVLDQPCLSPQIMTRTACSTAFKAPSRGTYQYWFHVKKCRSISFFIQGTTFRLFMFAFFSFYGLFGN